MEPNPLRRHLRGRKNMKARSLRKRRVGVISAAVLALASVTTMSSHAQLPEAPQTPEIPEVPTAAPAASSPTILGVSPEFVTIHDKLSVLGANLAALQDDYKVTVGGMDAYPEEWSDTEIRFPMPTTDPGSQEVALGPKPKPAPVVMPEPWGTTSVAPTPDPVPEAPLPPIPVGTVTVAKYVLPEGEVPVPEVVKLRLAPEAIAEDVAIENDPFEPLIPAAEPGSLLSRWWKVKVPGGTEKERILAYAALDKVEVAEYEEKTTPSRAPSDAFYVNGDQWNVKKTRLTAAWEVRMMGAGIAILDTGVNPGHEEMAGLVVTNRHHADTTPVPCNGHATAVASIAAARTGNGAGIAGAAWMALIGSYKVQGEGQACEGPQSWSAAGITAAVADGYRIINMSYGNPSSFTSEQNAVTAAWDAGAFLVAAAGNNNSSTIRYPAGYDHVFAVANSTSTDARYSSTIDGSNYGSWVDLAAPGVNINAADLAGYNTWTGTSFAAPLVAGAASLLRADGLANLPTSQHATINAWIEQHLKDNADPIDWAGGAGRLNAYRALRPLQGCVRDVPLGAWVTRSNGMIYQVAGGNTLRYVSDPLIMDSWDSWGDRVFLCEDRAVMMMDEAPWGFRPGTLIRDASAGGAIYLITTDGDRGLPLKRHIASPQIMSCYGWTDWIEVSHAAASLHSDGAAIADCNPLLPRPFANGSLLRNPATGAMYMIEAGTKRYISHPDIAISWNFTSSDAISATDLELSLISDGPAWGFRQGKLVQPTGSYAIDFVTDDGALRGQGMRRHFNDPAAKNERGFGSTPVMVTPANLSSLHPEGMPLRNADDMP